MQGGTRRGEGGACERVSARRGKWRRREGKGKEAHVDGVLRGEAEALHEDKGRRRSGKGEVRTMPLPRASSSRLDIPAQTPLFTGENAGQPTLEGGKEPERKRTSGENRLIAQHPQPKDPRLEVVRLNYPAAYFSRLTSAQARKRGRRTPPPPVGQPSVWRSESSCAARSRGGQRTGKGRREVSAPSASALLRCGMPLWGLRGVS